jgi:hypothetical protein
MNGLQTLYRVSHGAESWEVLAPHKGAALAWFIRFKGRPQDIAGIVVRQAT